MKFTNLRFRAVAAGVAAAGAVAAGSLAVTAGPAQAALSGSSIVSIAKRELADTSRNYEYGTNCSYYGGVVFGWPSCGGSGRPGWGGGTSDYAWCAAFAKYVWREAGVTSYMKDVNGFAASFKNYGQSHGTWHPRGSYTPQPGDAVVFDNDSDPKIDHVGIVTSVSGSTVNTIEGNSSDRVASRSYSTSDSSIVGYTTAYGLGAASGGFGDYSGDGVSDVIGLQAGTADLIMYKGNGTNTVTSPVQIGNNWSNFDAILRPGDFDGDGVEDLIGRNKTDNNLYLFHGKGAATPAAPVKIGNNWANLDQLTAPGDFDGDGNPDIIARNTATNDLLLYRGNGKGGFIDSREIGSGWGNMDLIMSPGDFTGDGKPDVLARSATDHNLYLYTGDGTDLSTYGVVGSNWSVMRTIIGAGDLNNDGNNDIIAYNNNDADIYLYTGKGDGHIGSHYTIGNNWSSFTTIL